MSITTKLMAMRFFDREQEFEKLREIEELSAKFNSGKQVSNH